MDPSGKILIARIVGVHGIKGYVKLKCFTEHPDSVLKYKPLTDKDGREYVLTRQGQGGAADRIVVSIKGVTDRTTAEGLRSVEFFVPRAALGLKEGELLLSDLIGFDVVDAAGTRIGSAMRIENFGSGDALEVGLSSPSGKSAIVLLNDDGLIEIRVGEREIVINPDFLVE